MAELFSDPVWKDRIEAKKKELAPRMAVRMHADLQRIYGKKPNTCGECTYLIERRYGNTYFKCDKARDSRSSASDWRKSWEACGLFEARKAASSSEQDHG